MKEQVFLQPQGKVVPGLTSSFYYISDYRKLKSNSYFVQIAIPIYYLIPSIFFEAGLNYQMQNVTYEYNFAEGIVSEIPNNEYIPNDFLYNDIVKYDETKYLIYPIAAVNLFIFRNLHIRVEYLIPDQISTNIGIHYEF